MSFQIIHRLRGEIQNVPVFWVPTEGAMAGKMVVASPETMEPIPDFNGIAFDYQVGKFVLTEMEQGERTINYLQAKSYRQAQMEADFLKERLAFLSARLRIQAVAPSVPVVA